MQRYVPFEKAVNFRDMGGYTGADGRPVKWNRLYRCGQLSHLTDADMTRLAKLDPAVICDFRSGKELERSPSRVPTSHAAAMHHLEIWPKSATPFDQISRDLTSDELDDTAVFNVQKDSYREFVRDFGHKYAEMFALIDAAEGRPIVIHCTAGKDRTGFGAALILSALGVSEDTIIADYLLTNDCPWLQNYVRHLMGQVTDPDPAVPDDARFARFMNLFGARADRLQAAFEAMENHGGSIDGYLRDVLGVTDEKRARLREWFLER